MMHCHNLLHEDHDMMHQFSVGLNNGETDDRTYRDRRGHHRSRTTRA